MSDQINEVAQDVVRLLAEQKLSVGGEVAALLLAAVSLAEAANVPPAVMRAALDGTYESFWQSQKKH